MIVSHRPELRAGYRRALAPLGVRILASAPDPAVLIDPHLRVLMIDLTEREGMDLLRTASASRPDVRVLGIGYPPAPEQVEEATRLGVDSFLEEDPPEGKLSDAVADALDPARRRAATYETHVQRARESFRRRQVRQGEAHARRAVAADPARPEAYNLLGVAREATVHRAEALAFYRMALALDPGYELARRNAETAARAPGRRGPVEFE